MRLFCALTLQWSVAVLQATAIRFHPNTGQLVHRDERPGKGNFLPPPSQDPWYRAPDGWEKANPGEALKTRSHAHPTINIRHCIDTFQVLFRSSDTHNNPSWAVATVFIPESHKNCSAANQDACANAVVSYQVPTDSADPDAAPSYLLQAKDPYGEIRDLLARGYFVAVPDFEGPLASFCAGVQSGHATLDAGRAVMSVAGQWGLRTDKAKFALWGYSGGSFATQFAVELASTYAPDFKIAGAIVGGPSPNLTTMAEKMNKHDTAGLIVNALLGITAQQPKAREYLMKQLKEAGPYNATRFMKANKMTGLDALYAFNGQDVFAYFKNGIDDLYNPIIQDVFTSDAFMGLHGVPNMPCFYYKSIPDEMSPIQETDDLIAKQCKAGANILYHRNSLGGHNDELWSGRMRSYDYLAAVLDGTHSNLTVPERGCRTENVTVPLDPLYLIPDWWWTEGPWIPALEPPRNDS